VSDLGWLTTFTGKRFYPARPRAEDIDILDIAHALSNIYRYCGHTNRFYSVGEHSVRLCDLVLPKYKPLAPFALIHDGAEVYLGDVPSLLKRFLFTGYIAYEEAILDVIVKKFNVKRYDIKKYENQLLAVEVRDLGINDEGWYLPEQPADIRIVPWVPMHAEEEFLDRFSTLIDKQGG
jgi:hypothetical protein